MNPYFPFTGGNLQLGECFRGVKRFQCPQCLRVLASKQSFREHVYIHTGEKPFQCSEPGCTERFRQGSQLSVHRRIHKTLDRLAQGTTFIPQVLPTQLTELLANEESRARKKPCTVPQGPMKAGEEVLPALRCSKDSAAYYVE